MLNKGKALLSILFKEEADQPYCDWYEGVPALMKFAGAPPDEAITEPATAGAKSYKMSSFHRAMRSTAYSFLDFYSNKWNLAGYFLLEAGPAPNDEGIYFTTWSSK
jgi:hypothetical protein